MNLNVNIIETKLEWNWNDTSHEKFECIEILKRLVISNHSSISRTFVIMSLLEMLKYVNQLSYMIDYKLLVYNWCICTVQLKIITITYIYEFKVYLV